ncbi:MAG: PilZ domain-containing protein, partial [bacterium]|nr:PilZ domain-containing protein [bacterium]
MTTNERRKAVRSPAKLAMELKLSGKSHGRVESINVSANGVYFSSPTFIAPLTKLQITLLLPESSDPESTKKHEVTCDGVVVRTEPEELQEGIDAYEIACYFTNIPEAGRERLEA